MPELSKNTNPEDLRWQFITGNRHNASFYRYLADAKIAVYLNGWNPVGYQFWEYAALKCAQVVQSPRPNKWYNGGSYVTERFDWECYDPPFEPGQHFLSIESPDEMLEKIDYLLEHDNYRKEMALRCHELAMKYYTWKTRTKEFLQYLFRNP